MAKGLEAKAEVSLAMRL